MAEWKGLTLTANAASTVRLQANGTVYDTYEYTLNDGATWTSLNIYGGGSISLSVGQSMGIRITAEKRAWSSTGDFVTFITSGDISLSGKINSIVTPSFETTEDISSHRCAFYKLFYESNGITDASKLKMPSGALSDNCCTFMFYYCKNLVYAPELPSTQLNSDCYMQMFEMCTSLKEAPELPATTLAYGCYQSMFNGCRSLIRPVALPATELKDRCYYGMFNGCTNIKMSTDWSEEYAMPYIIPSGGEPATPGADSLAYMFSSTGGTFVGTPSINTEYYFSDPAALDYFKFEVIDGENVTITSDAYYKWSVNGVSWTDGTSYTVPVGSFVYCKATSSTGYSNTFVMSGAGDVKISGDIKYLMFENYMRDYQFAHLFAYCDQLVDAGDVIMSPDDIVPSCYEGMFKGCVNLLYPPDELPATYLADECYSEMFSGCSSLTYTTQMSATSLAQNCCHEMYRDCTSLVEVKPLIADVLAAHCYEEMFRGCTSLVNPPALIAPTMAVSCYADMFNGCTNLATVPELNSMALNSSCYYQMFANCKSLRKPPKLNATTLSDSCYYGMFYNCTNMEISDEPTEDFNEPYRIPTTGTGSDSYNALAQMFYNTAGPWTGTPVINRTYYLRGNNYKGLKLTANEDTRVRLNSTGAIYDTYEYSLDNGETWHNLVLNSTTVELEAGDVMCVKIKNIQYSGRDGAFVNFSSSGSISASGNATSMIVPNFEEQINISAYPYSLHCLFKDCVELRSAPELPAIILGPHCYDGMFTNCVLLEEPPVLPARTLASGCYQDMFYKCESLKEAPALPAESLATHCYADMFGRCTGLTKAPELPADSATDFCYNGMFAYCTGLTECPELPATYVGASSYSAMFEGCTGLTEPAFLVPQHLSVRSYELMFYKCTGIEISDVMTDEFNRPYRIPVEGEGTTETESISSMFVDIHPDSPWSGTPEINRTYYLRDNSYKGLKLKAETDIRVSLVSNGTIKDMYEYSLDGGETWEWLRLSSSPSASYTVTVPAGSTMYVRIQNEMLTRSDRDFVQFYINGVVSASGNVNSMITPNFENVTDISKYNYALRNLFNSIDYLSDITKLELPATTLSKYCYANMFQSCHNITEAPVLPATNLAMACYSCMFAGTSLDIPPELPATTMSEYCYNGMFHASLITKVPELPATVLADFCYSEMFELCPNIDTPPALPAQVLSPYCYYKMFYNCGKIKMSDVMTDEYNVPYIIPSEGVGTSAPSATSDMFELTTGPWHSTPAINTVYYLKGRPKEGIYHWTGTRWKLDGNVCESKAAVSDKGMHHWTGTRWKLDGNVGGVE